MKTLPIIALALTLQGMALAQDAASTESFPFRGRVLDAESKPVVNSVVTPLTADGTLLQAKSSAMLDMDSFFEGFSDDESFVLWSVTDERGEFVLNLPIGDWRFVALSWPESETFRGHLEKNGNHVRLDGVGTASFDSELEASIPIEIRPVGTGTALMSSQEAGDLILISAAPRMVDPILGPVAFYGDFWPQILIGGRMEKKSIRISGLPEGDLQFFSLVNDNNGGMGGATARIVADTETAVYVPVIAGWSNGHRTPPDRLRELTDYFLAHGDEMQKVQERSEAITTANSPADEMMKNSDRVAAMGRLAKHVDDPWTLANGTEVSFGDALAAVNYARMAQSDKRRGRRD